MILKVVGDPFSPEYPIYISIGALMRSTPDWLTPLDVVFPSNPKEESVVLELVVFRLVPLCMLQKSPQSSKSHSVHPPRMPYPGFLFFQRVPWTFFPPQKAPQ